MRKNSKVILAFWLTILTNRNRVVLYINMMMAYDPVQRRFYLSQDSNIYYQDDNVTTHLCNFFAPELSRKLTQTLQQKSVEMQKLSVYEKILIKMVVTFTYAKRAIDASHNDYVNQSKDEFDVDVYRYLR